jgi:DNA-binding CsgD family transcriptional regulator
MPRTDPADFTRKTAFYPSSYAGVTLSSRGEAHLGPTETGNGEPPANQFSDEERWNQMISIRSQKAARWSTSADKDNIPYTMFARKPRATPPELQASKLLCPEWRGPLMVIDCATLRVDYVNRNGVAFLSRDFGLKLQNGLLNFTHCHERKSFQARIQAARATGQASSAMTFRNAETGAWALVAVRFLAADEANAVTASSAMADELNDPAVIEFTECGYAPDRECFGAIAEALKLSPSESRDLIAIATGYTADEIAVKSGVAISTIRQRIKSLLAKAECSRQQELTCLVRSLCPSAQGKLEKWPELQYGFTANCAKPHAIAAE